MLRGNGCFASAARAQTAPPAAQPAAQQPGDELVVDVTGGMAAPLGIAIPALPTSAIQQTAAGSTDVLGRQLADIIRNDLGNSGLFRLLGADRLRPISFVKRPLAQFR